MSKNCIDYKQNLKIRLGYRVNNCQPHKTQLNRNLFLRSNKVIEHKCTECTS